MMETEVRPAVLDERNAAVYIGMSVAFLRRARVRGKCRTETPGPRYIKRGSRVLYRTQDLDAWLDEGVQG